MGPDGIGSQDLVGAAALVAVGSPGRYRGGHCRLWLQQRTATVAQNSWQDSGRLL